MSLSARLSRIVVHGLPLAFVIVSWVISAGFPYYLDNNESFLSYLHARNLEIWNPWQYAWMTAEATDPERATSENFYTHQPNAPRFVHYALLRLGVRELSTQVLLISLVASGLTAVLLWRLFGSPLLMTVALAVVLDYAGFLAWTVNTYRIWMFVLFFGMVLAVRRDRPLWYGAMTFCVIQLDFGIAAFVGAATGVFALFTHRARAWRFVLAAAIGGVASLTLFGAQVLAFYGWEGFVHELAVTYIRRGTAGEAGGLGRYLFQAWHGPLLVLNMITRETHNPAVMVLVLWGVLVSGIALRRKTLDEPTRFVAHLTLSAVAGAVFASTVLYGYFVDAFVVSVLPLATFLIAPALGVVALELRTMLDRFGRLPGRGALPVVIVLAAVGGCVADPLPAACGGRAVRPPPDRVSR